MRPRTLPNPSFWIGECKGSLVQVRDRGVVCGPQKKTEISRIFVQKQKRLARRGCPLLAWYIEHDFITVDRSHHRTLANALTILHSDQTPHIF